MADRNLYDSNAGSTTVTQTPDVSDDDVRNAGVLQLEPFLEVPKINELVELYVNKYCGLLLKLNQRKLALDKLKENKDSGTFPNSIKLSSKILTPKEFKSDPKFQAIVKEDEDALLATMIGTLDRLIKLEEYKVQAVQKQTLAVLDELSKILRDINVQEFGFDGGVCRALVTHVKNAGILKSNQQLLERKLTAVKKKSMAKKVNDLEVEMMDNDDNAQLVKDLVKLAINPLYERIKHLEKDKRNSNNNTRNNTNNNNNNRNNSNKHDSNNNTNNNAAKKSKATTSTAKKKKNESRRNENTQATNVNASKSENTSKRNVQRTSIVNNSTRKKRK